MKRKREKKIKKRAVPVPRPRARAPVVRPVVPRARLAAVPVIRRESGGGAGGQSFGFGDVLATFWRCLAMFGDGTHQTAAHLAHGTSLVASFPSPVSRFFPFFALSYPGTLTLAGGGMPMLLSTVEFGARLALNALFPQHEHIAIPSVFGTPPCVLAALAFAVALALCLAWVETPICVGLVRGSAVGNDGGGRTAGRLARAGAVNLLLVTLMVPVFGVVFGALFLGERLTPSAFAGFAAIALGLLVTDGRLFRHRRNKQAAPLL